MRHMPISEFKLLIEKLNIYGNKFCSKYCSIEKEIFESVKRYKYNGDYIEKVIEEGFENSLKLTFVSDDCPISVEDLINNFIFVSCNYSFRDEITRIKFKTNDKNINTFYIDLDGKVIINVCDGSVTGDRNCLISDVYSDSFFFEIPYVQR